MFFLSHKNNRLFQSISTVPTAFISSGLCFLRVVWCKETCVRLTNVFSVDFTKEHIYFAQYKAFYLKLSSKRTFKRYLLEFCFLGKMGNNLYKTDHQTSLNILRRYFGSIAFSSLYLTQICFHGHVL